MESTDLLAVQVTTRGRYRVRGGDETLKRRVAAKFPEGDASGAVRELASAEGSAPQDGDTLRALKEKHPPAPKNLNLPDPPDGSKVPAVAKEDVRKRNLSFHAGASGGPDGLRPGHLRSLVSHGSAEAGSHFLSVLTDMVNVHSLLFLYSTARMNVPLGKKVVASGQLEVDPRRDEDVSPMSSYRCKLRPTWMFMDRMIAPINVHSTS